jgi:hypothetical protein
MRWPTIVPVDGSSSADEDVRVGDKDGLIAVGLFFCIIIYVLFSTLDIISLLGGSRRLPDVLELVYEAMDAAFTKPWHSDMRRLAEFLVIVASTQIGPLILLAWPRATTPLKAASVIELLLAVTWTIYLVRVSDRPRG